MIDIKISDLPSASTLDGTELVPIVQTGATVKTTTQDIANLGGGGGSGTVTSVSVTTANGVSGSVATPNTTPAISLTLGAITPTSVAASGTVTGSNLSGVNTGNQTITLTGDITGSGTGTFAATISAHVVSNSKLAQMAAGTIKGNNTGATADALDLSSTQVTAMLDAFSSSLKGLTPASGGGTTNFLRADGSWAVPASGGSGTVTSVDVSGGATGLTTSGGPVTSSGTITLGGTLAIANGGTGQTSQQAAINALTGAQSNGKYLRSDGTNATLSNIQAGDVPTLNQNTTGTASNITASSNSSLTSLPSLSLPGSQVSGNISGNAANITASSNSTLTSLPSLSLPGAQVSGDISGNAGNITASSNSTLTTLSSLSLPGSQVSGNISGDAANVTGVVAIANGGSGQTTANDALNAFLPDQTGNAGKILATDGTNTSWSSAGAGSVTSVDVSGGTTGLTTSGGPVTTSGTITLSGTLAVANGGTNSSTALNDNCIMVSNTGAIVELPQLTAQRALVSDGNGLPSVSATTDLEIGYVSGVTSGIQSQLDAKQPTIAIGNNVFVFTGNAGEIISIPGWTYYTNTLGANVNLSQAVTDTGGYTVQGYQILLDPTEASPSAQYNHFNIQTQIDPNSTGFPMGTGGSLSTIFNVGYTHTGTSNIGSLTVSNSYSNIGNGTDPIDVAGFYGHFVFGDVNDNVNLSRGFQGYIFQPHVHSAASFSNGGAHSNIFGDFANIEVSCDGWNSYSANPIIAGVHNNSNYIAFNVNPQIGTLEGNAGYQGIYLGGSIQTMGTNEYVGILHNVQIANMTSNSKALNIGGTATAGTAEWIGIDVQTNNINTTGPVRGIRINTPNSNTLDRSALDVNGRTNLQSGIELTSGLGQTYCNILGGGITIPNGTAITGTDVIGNNMAVGIDLGDAGSVWTAASIVGLTTLGFVGQIAGAGTANGPINFCLGGYADAHTGHIDRVNNFHAAAVPTGAGGTMDESVLYLGEAPFGYVATDNWGLRIESGLENYVDKLAVGTANKKVTNASCGIELDSTTQAILFSRMNTTQRNALTALNGMQIYNTTDNECQAYQNGVWTSLGGGGTVPRNLTSPWLTVDGTTLTITHNWGTRHIRIEVIDDSNNYETINVQSITRPTDNTVVLTASEAPSSAWTVLLTEVTN